MSEKNSSESANRSYIDFEIVDMDYLDIIDIVRIEEASFLQPWSPDIFIHEFFNEQSRRFVARITSPTNIKGQIAGYIIYWKIIYDEFHLMSIAVDSRFRKCGVGTALMCKMIDEANNCNARIVLEVRASNMPAQRLYSSFGFKPIGLRKNYYKEPNEDALLMELNLREDA